MEDFDVRHHRPGPAGRVDAVVALVPGLAKTRSRGLGSQRSTKLSYGRVYSFSADPVLGNLTVGEGSNSGWTPGSRRAFSVHQNHPERVSGVPAGYLHFLQMQAFRVRACPLVICRFTCNEGVGSSSLPAGSYLLRCPHPGRPKPITKSRRQGGGKGPSPASSPKCGPRGLPLPALAAFRSRACRLNTAEPRSSKRRHLWAKAIVRRSADRADPGDRYDA